MLEECFSINFHHHIMLTRRVHNGLLAQGLELEWPELRGGVGWRGGVEYFILEVRLSTSPGKPWLYLEETWWGRSSSRVFHSS